MTPDYNILIALVIISIGIFIGYFVSKESRRSLRSLNKKKEEFEKSGKNMHREPKRSKEVVHA
ncbi:hypothetical protein IQ13_1372 [Lacibacter cauensis]|uniref:Uncharacterized protein n=1 Tax=Lacibacter cauensis TaxID=510947 RepID=A0A562SQH6_9BACT|nr:hypothetical protein IQ13_1372 [Lacibacter cauensis]